MYNVAIFYFKMAASYSHQVYIISIFENWFSNIIIRFYDFDGCNLSEFFIHHLKKNYRHLETYF